jgi:hypothetical protein
MNEDYEKDQKEEKPFGSRKPILVGEAPKMDSGNPAEEEGSLSTADIAGAGERRAMTKESPPGEASEAGKSRTTSPGGNGSERSTPLFSTDEASQFRSRWDAIQVGFVDEPRRAVEQADELVASTIKRLAEIFADERTKLEHQWSRGDQVSTEDLRVALQRYRSFFGRLLSV